MSNEPSAYNDVLIPSDGSKQAEHAVDHAIRLADQYDATIHAMNVIDERRHGKTPAMSSYELTFEQFQEAAEELTSGIAEKAREKSLDATTAVPRGRPSEEIVDYADEHDVDLIVMGRTGVDGAGRPHIGSVSDRVLRSTDVPVFSV